MLGEVHIPPAGRCAGVNGLANNGRCWAVVMVELYVVGSAINVWKRRKCPFYTDTDWSSLFLQSMLQLAIRKPVKAIKFLWCAKLASKYGLVSPAAVLQPAKTLLCELPPSLLHLQQKTNLFTGSNGLLAPHVGNLPFWIPREQRGVWWTLSVKLRMWDWFHDFCSEEGLWNHIAAVSSSHCPCVGADCPFVPV